MARITRVELAARSLAPFEELFGSAEMNRVRESALRLNTRLRGRIVWTVNSTARGGGVAELLRSIVAYARGAGVDCHWVVTGGSEPFFRLTKRLHNALHGAPGEPSLDAEQHALYERVSLENAAELMALVCPGDVVILHDPQTAGLCEALRRHGAYVIWRCHIGRDVPNEPSRAGWEFLSRYVRWAHVRVFTRGAYVPEQLRALPCVIIPPTIDPASPKNRPIDDATARAILVQAGLVEGPGAEGVLPTFCEEDGSMSVVRHAADVLRLGRAPTWDEPLIVQVSRWDRLKDPVGVMRGFAQYSSSGMPGVLVLAGPNVHAVADDPEGAEVFAEVETAFRELPHGVRRYVQLASLPMSSAQENAAIVNALQRHAAVVVQKSLQEGFGLTVSEAMWKARPVIASRVGGIQDQIEHEVSGLLLDDPEDLSAFAAALARVMGDPEFARKLGERAVERVRERFVSLRSLYAYSDLIVEIVDKNPRP